VNHRIPWPRPRRSVVAVGLFDGVHRGHRLLLGELVNWAARAGAEPVVITFDPHPAAVVAGVAPPLVTGPRERVRLIQALGIERVWLLPATPAFVKVRAEEFLRRYVCGDLGAIGLLVGFDNRLGSDQAGFAALRALGASLGLEVRTCAPFLLRGEPISSTALRQAIAAGDLARAAEMLGRPVSFAGRVVRGAGRGKGLGYPTANVALEHEVMVPCGIYGGEAVLEGKRYLAAISVGACPTFGAADAAPARGAYVAGAHVIEVHLLDFEGDLAGRELEVELDGKLREEEKFASPEALVAQMARDVAAIRAGRGGP
jgi:riboflavin kinase / FMN adenylyltransferase